MIVQNNAPAAPTGVTVTAGVKSLNVSWTACPDIDYQGSIVEISNSATGPWTFVAEISGTSCVVPNIPESTQKYIRVAHYDSFGKTSLNYSSGVAGITSAFSTAVDAKIASAVISGSQLVGNSIPVSALSTEALYAPTVVVGDVRNLITNSCGEIGGTPSVQGWTGATNAYFDATMAAYWPTVNKGYNIVFDNHDAYFSQPFAVTVGDSYWCAFDSVPRGGGSANYDCKLGIALLDKNKTMFAWIGGAVRTKSISGGYHAEGTCTVTNSNAAYAQIWFQIDKPAGENITGTNGNGFHCTALTVVPKNKGNLIVDGTLTGNHIAANSITADKIDTRGLTIKDSAGNIIIAQGQAISDAYIPALGGNLIPNSSFIKCQKGIWSSPTTNNAGWQFAETNGSATAIVGTNHDPNWTVTGGSTLFIQQSSGHTDPSWYHGVYSDHITVEPGKRYCLSAYTGSHRCKVSLFVYWFKADGSFASSQFGLTSDNNQEASGGNNLTGYKRQYAMGYAPTDAVTARVVLRKHDTVVGQPSSYLFATNVQLEQVSSYASSPGAYSESGLMAMIGANTIGSYMQSAAIGNAYISSLDAGKITTGYLAAERIDVAGVLNLGANNQTIQGSGTTINKYGMVVRDGNNVARVKLGNLAFL